MPWVEYLRNRAKSYSGGQDDPVLLSLFDEGERDLYFVFSKNRKRQLNGGIIWHEHSGEYGVHT